jgi:hypothetical protein
MKMNLLKGLGKKIAATLIAVFLCSGAQASVTFLGVEQGNAGSNFSVQNWSNSSVVKAFDTGGDVYGSSGYYQIRPMPWDPGSASIYESVSSGNLLGTDLGSNPSLSLTPSFVSSISGGAGSFVNFGGYPIFRGPDGSSLYRQGALSVSVNNGIYNTPSGSNNGYFGVAFNFTISAPTKFRFGLAVDTAANGLYAPDYVGVYSGNTGTVYSSLLTRDGTPDMAVFEIDALANETFTVSVWQLDGTQSIAPFSLATFDAVAIPEPSSWSLILIGCGSLIALRRLKRNG